MKARPKTTTAELKKLLPKRLGGEQLDTPGLEHHAQLVALDADPLARVNPPNADGENRGITKAMQKAMEVKPKDGNDPVTGPRFVMMWRMYPNALNAHIQTSGQCGCGCSCTC